MNNLEYSEVFVPGGFPRHTYNPRLSLELENRVALVKQNLCKLVAVTGHTKSGKTVLVRKILPRDQSIWIDGGSIGKEDDFWSSIIDQLSLFQIIENERTTEKTADVSAGFTGGANVLVVKGEAELGTSISSSHGSSSKQSRTLTSRISALKGLRENKRALVIDDFHYVPRALQGELIRAIKPLIFDGLPVVVIAIPHKRYDAIKVEREMTGRIFPVQIPSWSIEELQFIPETGFSLLNASITKTTTKILAEQSIGSPHLIQDFCRSICVALKNVAATERREVNFRLDDLRSIFKETAETIGRPIFEKLARGPRQRSDRISRMLKNGEKVDIYGLVLNALAYLKPDLVTLEYEGLRSAIKEISSQEIPQVHEVARVLKHMADIAATDQSSSPVIDFDEVEKRLHITDPYFAFYLRWGDISN